MLTQTFLAAFEIKSAEIRPHRNLGVGYSSRENGVVCSIDTIFEIMNIEALEAYQSIFGLTFPLEKEWIDQLFLFCVWTPGGVICHATISVSVIQTLQS